jgi:hypothetical protein
VAGLGRRLLIVGGVLDPHAIWCYFARRACDEWITAERPDVVITSGPPHSVHLLGRWLRRRHSIRLVTDYRDAWIEHRHAGGPRAAMRCRLERATMRASDGIIANAPRALDVIATEYPGCAHKMVMVPNGYDPAPPTARDYRPDADAPLSILHAGELYADRDPRPLLDAIGSSEQMARQSIPWHLRFVGRTAETGLDIVAEARRRQLRSLVSVEPQIAYNLATDEMRRAGILLLMDGPGRREGAPAKVYEYIGANRPILALAEPDGDTAWALETSGATYRLARPGDTEAIRWALVEISELARAGATGAVRQSNALFTRERLAEELATFLEKVATGERVRTPTAVGRTGD